MRLWSILSAAFIAVSFCACSGGSGANTSNALLPPQPNSSTASTQIYALTGGTQTLGLPAGNTCTGRVTLPFARMSAGTSMTITTSRVAPAGTALVRAAVRPLAAGALDFLCYVTLVVSKTVTYSSLPGFAVTIAPTISTAAPQQFFYAISEPTVTNVALAFKTEGPASVSGQTLTFAAAPDSLTLLAGKSYVFAFYETFSPMHVSARLYVANSNSVSVFDIAHAYAPLPPITDPGLRYAAFLAIDANGKLYVSCNGNGMSHAHVNVFDTLHANAPLPQITFSATGSAPAIAIDTRGRLYATNVEAGQAVSVFDTLHANAPLPPISSDALFNPTAVAVDAGGKLYVTNSGGFHSGPSTVSVFDTLNGDKALPQIEGGGFSTSDSAVVSSNGTLYAANFQDGGEIDLYDTLRSNAALPNIKILCAGINSFCGSIYLRGIALDTNGLLYAAVEGFDTNNQPVNTLLVFDTAHGNIQLPAIVGNGLNSPGGVAVY